MKLSRDTLILIGGAWAAIFIWIQFLGSGTDENDGDRGSSFLENIADPLGSLEALVAGATYSDNALALARQSESLRTTAYQDSVGVWTIGYGHTGGVSYGMTCTADEAEAWLRSDMDSAAFGVNRLVKVPLDQGQFDALCDFVFNLGAGKLGKSTLLAKLNAGDYAGARSELSRWVYAGNVQLGGLVTRRNAEMAMFSSSAPQGDVQYASSGDDYYDDEVYT